MNKVAEVEAEFDEPLRDVIVIMRQQGNTWRTIASALNVSRFTLYHWRQELGIEDHRRLRDAFSASPSKTDMAARRLGYRNARQAVVDLRTSGHTLQETAEILGVSPHTVTRHYPEGFAGTVFVKTEAYREALRRTGRMAVERRRRRKAQNPRARWRSL